MEARSKMTKLPVDTCLEDKCHNLIEQHSDRVIANEFALQKKALMKEVEEVSDQYYGDV